MNKMEKEAETYPENINSENLTPIKARPIGGWLWVIMITLVIFGLITLGTFIQSTIAFLQTEWFSYFSISDKLVKQWILINAFLIFCSVGSLILVPLALNSFFKRKKNFKDMLVGLLGYMFIAQIIRSAMVAHYYSLASQHLTSPDYGMYKVAILLVVAGLYLNKGKRPLQTFKY
jgi:hypothetical protein